MGKYSSTGMCCMDTPLIVLHQVSPAGFVASSSHLLSTYYALDSMLGAICLFTHLRLTTTLWSQSCYHHFHFISDKTVAQSKVTFLGHQAYYWAEPGFEPREFCSWACAVKHNSIFCAVSQLDDAQNLGKQGKLLVGKGGGHSQWLPWKVLEGRLTKGNNLTPSLRKHAAIPT